MSMIPEAHNGVFTVLSVTVCHRFFADKRPSFFLLFAAFYGITENGDVLALVFAVIPSLRPFS
jgi:hypothetical protein